MHRALRQLIDVDPDDSRRLEDALPTPQRLRLASHARRQLLAPLEHPGRWRAGLLFGRPIGAEVHVEHALPAGGPGWPGAGRSILEVDPGYLLGASDAVVRFNAELDWIGHWIMAPDRQLGPLRRDLRWVERAVRRGLVDARHPLLSVGWFGGALEMRAYIHLDGTPMVLPCDLGAPED